jgi:thiamine kinase-like enzyme
MRPTKHNNGGKTMPVSAQEIAAIYQTEQTAKPKARTLDDVPGTYEAITAEWLTAVLCRGTPGAKVTDFRVTDRSDGSSNRARIYLTYNDAGLRADLPPTVFCKGAVTMKNRVLQGLCTGAHGETMFFLKVRDRLGIETPQHIHAGYDPKSYAYMVVMKDIGATTHFCTEKTVIARANAEKIVNTLAKLHAKFYESPEIGTNTLPFKTWPQFWTDTLNAFPGFEEACDKAFDMAKHVIPPRLFARRPEVWPATLASVECHNQLPKMLVHCDVHLGNWYIAGNGDMGLTDWQAVSIGHWSRDFAYGLSTTLSVEDRREWFDDLLRLYLDRMAEYGVPRVSFDEALFNVRQQLMTALAYWTITLVPAPDMPAMQPPEITIELIKRIATAIDDMDALDTFK